MKKFIPKNLKKNRVKKYMKQKYGNKVFTKNGDLKISAIKDAVKKAKTKSMKDALNLAITLKKMKK